MIESKNKISSEQIDLKLKTIILTVGPYSCGKTYFINKIIPEIKEQGDVTLEYFDIKSKPFDLKEISHLSKYPVNTDFIILESVGLDKEFRENVKEIAEKNNYNLIIFMFDYKGKQPYYEYVEKNKDNTQKIFHQLNHMRNVTMREIGKKTFNIIRIKSHDINQYNIKLIDYDLYQECILSENFKYVIIGDIHGCYEEFISLLEENGFNIVDGKISHDTENVRVLLVGDLVDKGYDVKGVIEFIYNNMEWFLMVKGNHENFVYKFLKDDLSDNDIPSQETINKYFDSTTLFQSDSELKEKFFHIVDNMKPFLQHSMFIATHAPCDIKYLGKRNSNSEAQQRMIQYPKRMDFKDDKSYVEARYSRFEFIRNQSSESAPFHFFGHVSSDGIDSHINKFILDSGCVSGGELSSVSVSFCGIGEIKSVTSKHNKKVKKSKLVKFF